MIHENITYGYDWDSDTNTLIARENIRNYGMFSTYTLMLSSLIGVYKKHNTIVTNFDYKYIMDKFRWDKNVDMYQHFFSYNKDVCVDFSPEEIPGDLMHPDNQHLLYQSKFCKYYEPFIKKYFSPSETLKNKIEFLKNKYQINSNKTVSIIYRDSDKWTDMGGGFLSVQAGVYYRNFLLLIEEIIKNTGERPEILIQSENSGVVGVLLESGLGCKFIQETKLDKDQTKYPPIVTDINLRKEWLESYFAALFIHSQSKYVYTYTGNSSFFVYLMRGNTENFYQEKTFLMNPKDFFILNA